MVLPGLLAGQALSGTLHWQDWRVYHALAMGLIMRACERDAMESTLLELDATAYAVGSTTIDLSSSLFD